MTVLNKNGDVCQLRSKEIIDLLGKWSPGQGEEGTQLKKYI